MMGNFASSMAGGVAGSVIGHSISNMMFGGRGGEEGEAVPAAAAPQVLASTLLLFCVVFYLAMPNVVLHSSGQLCSLLQEMQGGYEGDKYSDPYGDQQETVHRGICEREEVWTFFCLLN